MHSCMLVAFFPARPSHHEVCNNIAVASGSVRSLYDGDCFHVSRPTPNFRIFIFPIFTLPPTVAIFEVVQIRRCLAVEIAVRNVFTTLSAATLLCPIMSSLVLHPSDGRVHCRNASTWAASTVQAFSRCCSCAANYKRISILL